MVGPTGNLVAPEIQPPQENFSLGKIRFLQGHVRTLPRVYVRTLLNSMFALSIETMFALCLEPMFELCLEPMFALL